MELSAPARRVLGALIEKKMATPQGYPLSLNATRTACNQTTNRDPVVDYSDITVNDALKELRALDLVKTEYAARSNTPKYAHLLDEYFELDDGQTALLGVLMLRGPQTVGELRQRTDRMHSFPELGDVHAALQALSEHMLGALVRELPRQPGQKETRWTHLLAGEDETEQLQPSPATFAAPAPSPTAAGAASPSSATSVAAMSTAGSAPPAPSVAGGSGVDDLVEQVEELRDDLETLRIEVDRLRRVVDERNG